MITMAQDTPVANQLSTEEIESYIQDVSMLVNYLEDTYNFLGDPTTVPKEKEIVINESYLKIFKDDKVQIEDDLDENRKVPLHKDVQAYLKDIGFFYKTVKFEFIISDISHKINGENQHFFLISFNRILKGISIGNDSVNSRLQRFMEINLDIPNNDLKIASIYTTKLNEKEENRNWWNDLDAAWRNYFGEDIIVFDLIHLSQVIQIKDSLLICEKINQAVSDTNLSFSENSVYDTIKYSTQDIDIKLKNIINRQKVNISGIQEISNLIPLSQLNELTEINCSNTLILDLTPLRNLNKLKTLDFSETPVDDISPLYYSNTIKDLNCSYTLLSELEAIGGWSDLEKLNCAGIRISNLDFLMGFAHLKYLDCSYTNIHDLDALSKLNQLEYLEISGTKVRKLQPLTGLQNLQYLNCEFSSIKSIKPLSQVLGLKTLRISNTEIRTLEDLSDLSNLEKVYCDNTLIEKEETIQFMRDHSGCLVIFESEDLLNGWEELDEEWKIIARDYTTISENPTKEELHSLLKMEELDISGDENIKTLEPVRRLYNLKKFNISNDQFEDFSPIGDAIELEDLNLSNTNIGSLGFLNKLYLLQYLNIENTQVKTLDSLVGLKSLKIIFADESGIDDQAAFEFRKNQPNCIVVYKTNELNKWWEQLPEAWKNVFISELNIGTSPNPVQLHQILFLDSLNIRKAEKLASLEPLNIMKGLRYLKFTGTKIQDLSPLSMLTNLTTLECPQNPVNDLIPLTSLQKLELLNIENTPVSDLKPISLNTQLKVLKCSGTQISSLKPVSVLTNLEQLEINNTSIKNIKPLSDLSGLLTLECFNTRISSKNIERFKNANPECEVVFY